MQCHIVAYLIFSMLESGISRVGQDPGYPAELLRVYTVTSPRKPIINYPTHWE